MITVRTKEDQSQWQLLRTPPGEAQSGRVRYAAAMYFHEQGQIDSGTLEDFRVCAKQDADPPQCWTSLTMTEEKARDETR